MSKPIHAEWNLGALDFFLLWAGAAISPAEIWAGGLLVPIGLAGGLLAIQLGHIIGNMPMALGGMIGSRHGAPAMISTRGALAIRELYLPAGWNIIQLVGWTAVLLWICGHTAAWLAPATGWLHQTHGIVIAGALATLWVLSGHRLWKGLQRGAVTLLAALFPTSKYEGFLLLIGAMFCPLFGVVLTHYFPLNRARYDAESVFGGPRYAFWKGVHISAFLAFSPPLNLQPSTMGPRS